MIIFEKLVAVDVVWVLLVRHMKRYVRDRGRVLSSVLQPFLFLVALGLGFSPVFKKAGNGNYFEFLVPGVIGAALLFNAVFSGSDLLWDRQFGFIKETLVAPVHRFQIMFGRSLGVAIVAVLQAVLVGTICAFVGLHHIGVSNVLLALGYSLLIAFFFSFFGSILGSYLDDPQSFSQIVNFIVTPIFYLSGAVFPLEGQGIFVKSLALINPLTYGIDGLRYALTGNNMVSPIESFSVLLGCNLVALPLAAYTFSRIKV